MRAVLPGAVLLTPVYDQADLVNASIEGVRDAIVIGAILSVIVLLVPSTTRTKRACPKGAIRCGSCACSSLAAMSATPVA